MKKIVIKSTFAFALIFAFSLFGFTAAFGYGGGGHPGGGGGNSNPSVVNAVNYPMTLLPTQEGTLTSNFGQQGTVVLEVPKDANNVQTTFKIQMSAANANQQPDSTNGVYMIGNRIFYVEAKDINKNDVTDFDETLTITFSLPEMPADANGLGVYWLDNTNGEWVLVSGADFSTIGKATIMVDHLTAFAVINGDNAGEIALAKESKPKKTVSAEVVKQAKKNNDNNDEVVVLGIEGYGEGALLRGVDKKVYVIRNGVRQHIKTMAQLRQYAGQPIVDVDDETLGQYDVADAAEVVGEAKLMRDKNKKIYLIQNNNRLHIKTMAQLRQYAGQPITDVDDEVLEQYEEVSVLGIKGFGDGSLIRGADLKVYVIKNGKKNHVNSLNELKKYAGQAINNVDNEVLAQY